MSELKPEAAPSVESSGPQEDGPSVTQALPQQSYPVVYPYVDSYGAPIAHGGAQTVVPTYYFPTPQVYSYPIHPSGPAGGHEESMLSVPSFYGMPTPPRPMGTAPDGSNVVYGAWPSSATPEAFYAQAPGMAYTYGQTLPNGSWVGCSCAGCRTPASSHGTPLPPSAPPSVGRTESDFPSSAPPSASNPKPSAAPPPAATTPLSSRPGESADLRRRIFPGRPGSNSLENSLVSTPGSNAFPERKKRKMGYLNNILYKTEICRDYQQTGTCPRGKSCQFAHGGAEVHHPKNHPLYKTAYCFDFKKDGHCPRGEACFHVHHAAEMREKPNRSRGQRGSRFGRQGRGTPKGSPMVNGRARGGSGPPAPASSSGGSASPGGTSGEALPNPSDVKNTMRLLQRLSSENTANLLKKLSEGDSLRGSPLRH